VLFLDEMNEFPKQVVETLRQPLEDKEISLSRAMYRVKFPSDFILIGASNPCKCGNHGDDRGRPCTCTEKEVKNYMGRISGPILDRMDLYIEIKRLNEDELLNHMPSESSKEIRDRVEKSRLIQRKRFGGTKTNSQMSQSELKKYCSLGVEEKEIIKKASERMGLSARSFDKILKVSRTIADLEEIENIEKVHILEALSFRKNN
jgi:magnesium chelatase family protein